MLISHYRWLMLIGVVLFVVSPSVGFGEVTGWMAIWLGTCGGAFPRWRDDPGLWMLSGLFLALSCAVLVFFVSAQLQEVFQPGRVHLPGLSGYDVATATLLLAVQVLSLATVTIANWILRKKSATAEL
jgi:hypothetical protein